MLIIKTLNILTRSFRPIVNDVRSTTSTASWLVHEFVGENRARGFVALDDEFDPCAVRGLRFGVGVPGFVGAAVGVSVCFDAAKVVEVVVEDEHELETVGFGRGEGVVEAGNTCIIMMRKKDFRYLEKKGGSKGRLRVVGGKVRGQ